MFVDNTALWLVQRRVATPDEVELDRIRAEVEDANALFRNRGWLDDPSAYHAKPSQPEGHRTRRGRVGDLRYVSLTWPDEFHCRREEPGAERYASYGSNRIARAALLEHPSENRPWMICIHGFGMGAPGFDLRAFRARHLYRTLGLNLAFLTLPFHGRRGHGRASIPHVPGVDVLDTVHAVAQAVWDARQLLTHVQSRTEQPVGLMGLSLGALVAGIAASLEEPYAVMAMVPAVDLEALMIDGADRFGQQDLLDDTLVAHARPLLSTVSTTSFVPTVPVDRRFIVAGTLDRFVPASSQSHVLWEHWGRPAMKWFHGGHVSMYWARGVQDAIDDMLTSVGLTAPAA